MPVFARTKLMMEERCITLRPRLELSFKGPNPQNAYNKLLDILTHDIQIPRENIQEKEFNWERGSENEKFTAKFEIIKDFDKYSYMFLEIEMKGNIKPSKEFGKEGDMNIVVEGMVRTEYPQDTTWERSFLYEIFRMFYHKVFYQDQRKKYIENCRDWMLSIQSELKAFFNLLPKSG
jgi:hypothetical protein